MIIKIWYKLLYSQKILIINAVGEMVLKKDLSIERDPIIAPFLKWAGGKRWLVSKHSELFPAKYNTYIEPFLGSGAVFFHMSPKKAILGDANSELISTYKAIKEDWASVFKTLKLYHKRHNKDFYYEMRAKNLRSPITKAACFIYLNRTCWNGLYRVNLQGKFNVPIGTKKNVVLDTDDFESISDLLANTDLRVSDYQDIVDSARKNDFLFVDPPYTVKHNFNGFVKYNDKLFSWDDQIRLRDSIENAVSRGVKVLLTNADHESVRKLYKGVGKMTNADRLSVISGDAGARGRYSELIIKCYKD